MILIGSDYGKDKTFEQLSNELGIPQKELLKYNRWVTTDRLPSDREYLVTLPVKSEMISQVRSKLSILTSLSKATFRDTTGQPPFPILKKMIGVSKDPNEHTFYEINGLPGIDKPTGRMTLEALPEPEA